LTFATLNDTPITGGVVQVPSFGAWWAYVDLAEDVALSGLVTLKIADKTLLGTVIDGAPDTGRASYRVVGGHGGWGKELPAKPYNTDTGVKRSTVIGDAARECGEVVEGVPTTRTGPHYARAVGPASDALNALAPQAWRVDFDGVTRFGERSAVAYAGDGSRTRNARARGVFEIVTDTIGDLVPGVTIDGSQPATDVEYRVDSKSLTVVVYTDPTLDDRLSALRRLVLSLFPELRYTGTFEYRVVTISGERLNLQPVRIASGMPSLGRVPVRPGTAGLKSIATLGELVLVVFADRDPSRPQVIAFDAPDAPGFGVGIAAPIARLGDLIVGGGGGTIGASPGVPTRVSAL
jgi:hypothetical protein